MPNQVRMVLSPIELKEGEMGRTRNGQVYVGLANKQYIEVAGKVTGTTVVQPTTSASATVRAGGSAGDFSSYQGVLRVTNGQLQGDSTTDTVPEGANQYFTPARAQAAVQPGSHLYGASSANGNAYAITLVPAVTTLAVGMTVHVRATAANTGAATLQVNGLPTPAAAIKKQHDQDLAAGDIEAGQLFTVVWDGVCWQLQSAPADNTAAEVTTDTATFNGALSTADNTVQAALETLDNHAHTAGATASNTSGFTGALSATDNTVQKALDTLDDHAHTAAAVSAAVTGFTGALSATDNTVQKALDTLDDHAHTAAAVSAAVTGFTGALSATDNTVQKALDTLDDHAHTAAAVSAATTGFTGALSAADNTVQKALDSLDDHAHPAADIETTVAEFGGLLIGASKVQEALERLDSHEHSSTGAKNPIRLDSSNGTPRTTNGSTPWSGVEYPGTNYRTFLVTDFTPSEIKTMNFTVTLPADYQGGALIPTFYWSQIGTTTPSGGVTWGIQGLACGADDDLTADHGTMVEVTAAAPTRYRLAVTTGGALTLAGAPAAGKLAVFRALRNTSDSGDTFGHEARLHMITLTYE